MVEQVHMIFHLTKTNIKLYIHYHAEFRILVEINILFSQIIMIKQATI